MFFKGKKNHAAIGGMNTMKLAIEQDSYLGPAIKWAGFFIILVAIVFSIKPIHDQHIQEAIVDSAILNQKALYVSQMHQEMLLITSIQYEILHASNQQQISQLLKRLSERVSAYLLHYHQFEGIANNSDADMLKQLNANFEQWYQFNKNLLSYANVVSDSGLINTLNRVELAFSQLDSDFEQSQLLIAQLKQNIDSHKGL